MSTILSLYFLGVVSAVLLLVCSWPGRLLSAMGARLCCLSPCAASWSGAVVNRRKEGHGIFHRNNDVYEGSFLHDVKHGKGVMRWSDGASYDGDWQRDRPHGQGIWKAATATATAQQPTPAVAPASRSEDAPLPAPSPLSDSSAEPGSPASARATSYSGGWEGGEKSGAGVLMYSDGSIYTGTFVHDRQSGHGELVRKDGSCFIGEWKDGRYHGVGVLTRVNGDVLEGTFVRGLLEGDGTVRRYCGDEVTGSFQRGVLKGPGTIRRKVHRDDADTTRPIRKHTIPSPRSRSALSVATSRSYGDQRSERDCVDGDAEDVSYSLYTGEVSADFEMSGWGTTAFFPSGDRVWAQYLNGCGLGRDAQVGERMYCVYTYANGDVWDGDMRGWRRHGSGELRCADGRLYSGDCVADRKEGQGTYEDADGLYSGGWANDQREGEGVMEYRDGRRYEGAFSHDRRHGRGVLYYAQPSTASLSPAPSSPTAASPPAAPEDLFISQWRDDAPLSTSTSLRLAPLRLLQQRLFHLDEALAEVERESNVVDPARLCVLCGERERSVLLLECRHMALCEGCARGTPGSKDGGITACPLCHAPVTRVVTVHES